MKLLHTTSAALLAATFMAPTGAAAAVLSFDSFLTGGQQSPAVETQATGTASITVDDVAETISFQLSVIGIGLYDLWDTLVEAPVGPIHLHDGVRGQNGGVVVPFAFGMDTYSATESGFEVNVVDYAYADAAAISGTSLSFDEYVGRLQAGASYINVHTNTFNSGEIRGQVSPVPIPASLSLLIAAVGGLVGVRRLRKA